VTFAVAVLAAAPEAPAEEAEGPSGSAVPRGSSGAVVRPAERPDTPPEAQIVFPKQTKFVEPVYPPEAKAQGLRAQVVVLLEIDKTGKVTAATVPQPVGHGFDEAAQAAAMGLEFEPATRGGQPIAVRIPYRYTFDFEDVEQVVEPPEPPKVGNLGGQVMISGADMPLAAAEVVVTDSAGVAQTVTTDAEGRWMLEGLAPGPYKIRVASSGFTPVEMTEEVAAGEATDVVYRISPEVTGIEVTVRGERPPREVTRRTIERREMTRIPGTSGDALRSIQSLPGVARPPGLAGLLIVRGNAPQDTAVFIDGANVPLIYHFGGLSSAVPSELLDRIDFYPGNFSARYGQVMGGIVDVALREPNTRCKGDYGKPLDEDGCFNGLAQVDLIDARVLAQGAVGGWTFAVGGRRSWIDAWLKPILEEAGTGVATAPVYYDYQVIAETKPTPTSRFSTRFYGSDDRLKIILNDPFAQDPAFGGNLTFGTSYYRAQVLYETDLTRSVDLSAMVAVGNSSLDFALGPLKFLLDLYSISTRSELGFKLARGVKLNAGMDFNIAPYEVFVRGPAPPRPGEADPGPLTTRPILQAEESATAFRPAWYAEAEISPTRRAQIVPGIRLDYARDSGHEDVSPRVNARYDLFGGRAEDDRPLDERSLRTTLKGGVGLFYQPPQFQETNEVFGTPGIQSNRAIHYTVGVEQELTRQIEVAWEGYYKDLDDLVSRRPTIDAAGEYGNEGQGYVVGMEALAKYKPDKRFFGWLAYTLSRSVRQDTPDAPERLFEFDQTHSLTALGSYRLGRGWEFGARFRLISGPLQTPVLGPPNLPAIYAADAGAYTPLQGQPFSERMPLFHQLDVRVDKAWQFKAWRLSAYLDVQNVYNNPAREGVAYNYNFTQRTYQTGLPIIPSLGVRGEI
jgi:TonB family protein